MARYNSLVKKEPEADLDSRGGVTCFDQMGEKEVQKMEREREMERLNNHIFVVFHLSTLPDFPHLWFFLQTAHSLLTGQLALASKKNSY